MLTLKEPIQLHTVQPLTMAGEGFGERIIGNYEILGSKYESKDLLFLLTAPPELPEDLGGMTTIVEDQSISSVQNVTMDVVNHVVNRILLDGSSSFTYQDQVYITSVLNRLGITNVEQFMEEVRRLRVENESVVQMTQLYQNQLKQVLARESAGEETLRLPLPPERGEEEEAVRTRDPGLTMALNILNRLDTPRIYETVHAFRQNWTVNDQVVQQNTLRLTEQLRFSNAIELAETKQQVFQEPDINLLNHWNRYEHFDMAAPAATEAQVLRQAAAAALLTAVDNTLVEVLNCPVFHDQWLHVQNSFWQTAENTLNRFETYHSWEGLSAPEQPPAENREWHYYAQELEEFRTLEQQFLALPGSTPLRPAAEEQPEPPEQLRLQYLLNGEEESEETEDEEPDFGRETARSHHEESAAPDQPVKPGEKGTEGAEKAPVFAPELTEQTVLQQLLRKNSPRRDESRPIPGQTTPVQPLDLTMNVTREGDQTTVEEGDTLISTLDAQAARSGELPEAIRELQKAFLNGETVQLPGTHLQELLERETEKTRETILKQGSDTLRIETKNWTAPMASPKGTEASAELPEAAQQLVTERETLEKEIHSHVETRADRLLRQVLTHLPGREVGPTGLPPVPTQPVMPRASQTVTPVQREFLAPGEPPLTEEEELALTGALERIQAAPGLVERLTREELRTLLISGEAGSRTTQLIRETLEKLPGEAKPQSRPGGGTTTVLSSTTETIRPVEREHVRREEVSGEEREVPAARLLTQREELVRQIVEKTGGVTQNLFRQTTTVQPAAVPGGETPVTPVERQLLLPGEERETETETQLREELHTRQENLVRETVEKIYGDTTPGKPGERPVPGEPVKARTPEGITPVERELLVPGEDRETETELQQEQLLTQREQLVRDTVEKIYHDAAPGKPGERPVPTQPVKPGEKEGLPPVDRQHLTAGEAEVVAPEVLTQELTRIDRENREKLERVTLELQTREVKTQEPQGRTDIRRTMRDALRALTDQEGVLNEVPFAPAEMTMPAAYTPEEEALLRQASPEDRALYERVLAVNRDPEGAIALGLARQASMGSFQADLMQANREQAAVMEHLQMPDRAETERLIEQSESVLERFQQVPGQQTVIRETADRRPALKFIHKEAPPDLTEELMERLKETQTQSVVTQHTADQVVEQQSHTTNLNQMEHQVVNTTTQDVTELVNRTLARQMRTISDQVYRQMEKKLQMERNRRGRF